MRKTILGTIDKPRPDHKDEKDGYDGTEDTPRTDSVGNNHPQDVKENPEKEHDLSNRPNGYKKTGVAGDAILYPSD